MFSPDQNNAVLQWFAMNARCNTHEKFEGLSIPVPGLLKRILAALRGMRSRNETPAIQPTGKLAHGAPAR